MYVEESDESFPEEAECDNSLPPMQLEEHKEEEEQKWKSDKDQKEKEKKKIGAQRGMEGAKMESWGYSGKRQKRRQNRVHTTERAAKKLTEREDHSILKKIKENLRLNATKLAACVLEEFSKQVGAEIIRRDLRKEWFNGRVCRTKPYINEINKRMRLQFAREHVHKEENWWDVVMFADESKFNVFGSDGQQREKLLPGLNLETVSLKLNVYSVDEVLPGRWIGRTGLIRWPPRSPDLTPLDFYFLGFTKDHAYATKPRTIPELVERTEHTIQMVTPDMLTRVHKELIRRLHLCIQQNGTHFENCTP
ncbi:hypothetical protein ANN_19938 [Periplaneta americana]|uniref:Transposase Tc1-like domain-containing protein n=1 Tax=Periplaneta americana TaxID=6978 RepID=A0ABQ8SBX5_PERAM|nr:hypothetical protein ANN_19938 [Periplaneta americana]